MPRLVIVTLELLDLWLPQPEYMLGHGKTPQEILVLVHGQFVLPEWLQTSVASPSFHRVKYTLLVIAKSCSCDCIVESIFFRYGISVKGLRDYGINASQSQA